MTDPDGAAAEDPSAEDPSAEKAEAESGPDAGQAARVLGYLARQLVDEPDGVKVEESTDRGGIRLELFVAPGDMGKVIGRKGRIAQSIRAVVRAAAAREGTHVFVDIVD